MPVQQLSVGRDVYLFVLSNARGSSVTITNYGAIITSFKIKKRDGQLVDIVLGFDEPAQYRDGVYLAQYPWFGCAIGRYANRIKNARFRMDGSDYELTANHGKEQLHGGHKGFDRQEWQLVKTGEIPFPFVELRLDSPAGEEGFPGNLQTTIRFELTEQDELSYEYKATTDQPTPVNLTHHSYFNLNNGEGTIDEQEIKLYASRMLEQDESLCVTGNILPVEGTAFDFREFKSVGEGLTRVDEFDKSFVVDVNESKLVAEARSSHSGLLLQIYSTEPIIHFYSGKWIPEVKGKKNVIYGPFSGFCLETHKYPNAVNIPGFPNTILRPGELYRQKTTYRISS